MTNDEFSALVLKLEQQARARPASYQLRTLLLAMLGNAYLMLIVLLLLAVLLATLASIAILKAIGAKLALLVGFFLWGVIKALWIRIPPPEGTEINARQAPALFAMIGELQQALGAPQFHHVLITDDFNAGVIQAPQLGLFGWHRNYLLIGLPLLKSLTPEQFKAVLAHEFGHLAKGHACIGNWIYRQRYRWSRLMAQLEAQESKGSFLFRPFLKWYAPYLNAYSFPLARANEYEADAAAARLTSPRAAAEALTNVNVIGSYLNERFWPALHRQADDLPQPGFMPYASMGKNLSHEMDEATTQDWLQQALNRKSDIADTHPAFSDRLQAIGETAHLAPPASDAAADRLLGTALESITRSFDQRWLQHIQPSWEARHKEIQQGRTQLAALNQRHAAAETLSIAEQYDRALLTESIGGDAAAAFELLRELNRLAPDNAPVCFSLGLRLLNQDDASGVGLLQQAMAGDDELRLRCCEILRDYFWRIGEEEQAHAWHRQLLDAARLQEAAQKERDQVLLADRFDRHGLDAAMLAALQGQLRTVGGIRKVYLVRKRVAYRSDRPCYVLGFTLKGLLPLRRKQRVREVIGELQQQVAFPGETLLISVEGDNYRFGRKFRWMRGSRIL